jgi:hypothetical protein
MSVFNNARFLARASFKTPLFSARILKTPLFSAALGGHKKTRACVLGGMR